MASSSILPVPPSRSFRELTFGVEFEVLVKDESLQGYTRFRRAYELARVLKRHIDETEFGHPVEISGTLEGIGSEENANEENYAYAGLEVVSPVLPNTSVARAEVEKMAEAIRSYSASSFNDSCGLHVHVGRKREGFPLPALQKFVTLLLSGGEATLDLIHKPSRHGNMYCRPLATHSTVVQDPHEAPPTTGSVPEWVAQRILGAPGVDPALRVVLEKIWSAGDVSEFGKLIDSHGFRRLAYSFAGLPAWAGSKGTIEFRQAAGTLEGTRDLHFVVPWIQVVTGLVAWAVDADEDETVRAVEDVRASVLDEDPGKRMRRFLDSIGVNQAAAISMENRVHMIK